MKQKRSENKKSEKPLFQDFISHLNILIAESNGKKDPVAEVYKYLKRGFREKVENRYIEALCKYLFIWEHFPKLALRIALEVSTHKSSSCIETLFQSIKKEMAKRTKFPTDKILLFTNVSSAERHRTLQGWIKSNFKNGALELNWSRNAIICLMGAHITEDDFHATHAIVEGCFGKRKKSEGKRKSSMPDSVKDESYSSYVRLVGPLFISGKAALSRASFGLDRSRIFIARADRFESENSELKDIHVTLKTDLTNCHDIVNERDNALSQASHRIETLQKDIQSWQQSLEEERKRYKLLDDHWKEKSSHELARQAYSFKKYFSFEIREAILSLGTDHPDIPMALGRLKHMEEYLSSMEQSHERK